MLICEFFRVFSLFFKHEIYVLCSETLYTFNIRYTIRDSYGFRADPYYIKSVYGTTFCLSFGAGSSDLVKRTVNFIHAV
jgi:hypothetical protein